MYCERRTGRRDPGGSQVTVRETLGLEAISRLQPVTTAHYQKLLGVSGRVARRSLQKLRDLGLVDVHLTALHEPNRITLNARARRHLARTLGREPDDFRVMLGIGKVNLAHHEATVDVLIAARVGLAKSRRWRLVEYLLERDIRRKELVTRGALLPDAVAVLEGEGGERLAVAFEVDLGTENPSFIVQTKVEGYRRLREEGKPLLGCPSWLVCCTVPTERRRNRLAAAAWDAEVPEGLWYFAVQGEVGDQAILGKVWVTPRMVEGGRARLVAESPFQSVPTECTNGRYGQEEPSAGINGVSPSHEEGCFNSGDAR